MDSGEREYESEGGSVITKDPHRFAEAAQVAQQLEKAQPGAAANGAPVERPTVKRLMRLKAKERFFESSGFTVVKVTRGGTVEVYELPIRSTGVADVIERMRKSEPKPPVKPVYVTWDSPAGREMKMAKGDRQWVRMPDMGDEDYQKALEEYQSSLGMEVLNTGLDIELEDESGQLIPQDDRERRIAALKGLGMTSQQFAQIASDITMLTTLTDRDRETFFGGSSDGKTRT